MRSAYTVWIGQAIVLRLAAAGLQAPVPGIIVGESENAVRFRIGQGWDIDIPKSMILAVEEDICASVVQRPSNATGLSLGMSNAGERYPA
jgi:hypothetical protein